MIFHTLLRDECGVSGSEELAEDAITMLEKASGSKEVAAELGKAAPSRRSKRATVLPAKFRD